MIIEKDGRKCTCGRNGCYETYASMKALKTQLRRRFQNEDLSSKELLVLLHTPQNQEKVEDILQNYIEYLAIGIANITRICSSDVLAIGGSFVYYQDILLDRLKKQLDKVMTPYERETLEIRIAKLGNDAGMIGATQILLEE